MVLLFVLLCEGKAVGISFVADSLQSRIGGGGGGL